MKKQEKTKLTDEELDRGMEEFFELARKGLVPEFIMDEVCREANKAFGINMFPVEPIDPNDVQ